ncbi:MAG: hypothetical protein GY755_13445 [Chloroflexi bacterium]|nr:hypothetical protein [Chloroflexota bacterium]
MNDIDCVIGIDTGVTTGVAMYCVDAGILVYVDSGMIHSQMDYIKRNHSISKIFVRVEDARKRKWFGNSGKERLKGAGSVCRDAKIWEDFLTDLGIPFEMVAPKDNKTKLSAEAFEKITGWKGRTNEHSRDAAMLCFKFNPNKIKWQRKDLPSK